MADKKCIHCEYIFSSYSKSHVYCSIECYQAEQTKGYLVIFERDDFRCIYCGRSSIEDGVKLHLDHIVPKSIKLNNQASNLVTACADCNLRKHAKLFSEELLYRLLTTVDKRNFEHSIDPTQAIKLYGASKAKRSEAPTL